ncbi:MAG: hypothetical protein R3A10_09660 [Caldilineaceae bacterium]
MDRMGSFVEGILIGYGSILFVAVYLELARPWGQEMPFFGLLCAISSGSPG